MWRTLPIFAVVACNSAPPGPTGTPTGTPVPAAVSAAPGAPAVAVDLRALFDEAMRAELDGDALEARDRWIRLAAAAPDSPHGRYATQAASGSDGTLMFVGLGALVGVGTMLWGVTQAMSAAVAVVGSPEEPQAQVARIAEAAVTWRRDVGEGRRFPDRTELTPERSACVEGVPVAHDPEAFQSPAWQTLGFAMHEPFFYQYQYVAVPDGPQAGFTARALGDLDCDGVFSTYERVGYITAGGEVLVGDMRVVNDQE